MVTASSWVGPVNGVELIATPSYHAGVNQPGYVVALVVGRTTDIPGEVVEFDHAVAPAWRWHSDRLAAVLSDAGFDEVWRTAGRPDADGQGVNCIDSSIRPNRMVGRSRR